MNPVAIQPPIAVPPQWQVALARAGFAANGDGRYHCENIAFKLDDRWVELETVTHPAPPDVLRDLGRPGLWKRIGQGSAGRRVFEFPANAVCLDGDSEWNDAAAVSPDAYLAWALATANDGTPRGWQPPGRGLVESWLPHGALTVQAGSFVAQGELVLAPERWAVRFVILPAVPGDLSVARREWLRAVLGDAQTLWRLVRLGFAGDGAELSVVAEVDFTGAPPSEDLFLAGVHGVRHVVAALAETVELLADARVASETLALAPIPNPKPERSDPT